MMSSTDLRPHGFFRFMRVFSLVLLFCVAHRSLAAEPDKISITGKLGGGENFALSAVVGSLSLTEDDTPDSWGIWGASSATSKCGFESFNLLVAGHAVFIPRKALWDLRNVRRVYVSIPKGNKYQLLVHVLGGDAGASYSAQFLVNRGFLKERVVRHGEFPEETWERTTYSSALEYPQS